MEKSTVAKHLSTTTTTENDQNVVFNYFLLADKGLRDTTLFGIKVEMRDESGKLLKVNIVSAITDDFATAQKVFDHVFSHKIGPYTVNEMIEEWLYGNGWATAIPSSEDTAAPIVT